MDKATFLVLLDKYLEGKLQSEELNAFLNAMEENIEYKNEFDLHKSIKNSIILYNRNKFKEKLEKFRIENNTTDNTILTFKNNGANNIHNSKRSFTKYLIRVAAICIFVASIIAIRLNVQHEEILFSGNVKFTNLILDTIVLEEEVRRAEKKMTTNPNLIQDISELDKNNKALSHNDFKNDNTQLLFGASGNVFKNIFVFYTKKEQHFVVSDSLIKVYLNHRNFNEINKLELISKNVLYLYSDDEVIEVVNK